MKTPLEIQFGLAQAWLSMCTRSSELSQEQQENWLRLSTEVMHHYANERHTELHELQQTQDWQNLLMLMPGVAWRSVQNRMAVIQGAGQTAVTSQGALYSGWQEVLRDYVAASQAVLRDGAPTNGTSAASSFSPNALNNGLPTFDAVPAQLLKSWTDFMTQATAGAASTVPAGIFAANNAASEPAAASAKGKRK